MSGIQYYPIEIVLQPYVTTGIFHIKGILVTTADYGPDAYEFAKSKPLTLMNGSKLLYLLHKHGHKARIDIDEARKLLL